MSEDKEKNVLMSQVCVDTIMECEAPDPKGILILPSKNMILFPGVATSLNITREASLETLNYCHDNNQYVGVVCQKDTEQAWPKIPDDIMPVGVTCNVIKVIELPDGSKTALLQAKDKIEVVGKSRKHFPIGSALKGRIKIVEETGAINKEMSGIMKALTDLIKEMPMSGILPPIKVDQTSLSSIALFINTLCTNFPFSLEEKYEMLCLSDLYERGKLLLRLLVAKKQEADLLNNLMEEVKQEMGEEQKRAIMSKHIDLLQKELYGDNDEVAELRIKADEAKMSEDARKAFDRELEKLSHTNPQSPEYMVSYTYLTTLLALPWGIDSSTSTDFEKARTTLNNDHFGLEKVKERILEHVAVVQNNLRAKTEQPPSTTILCLVGPPGVGKTSLGRSIADALNLNYQRVALGGLSDEAEIRGHRRTYIGAMPGRIIDAMKRAKAMNPVIVLDEVDKVGKDYKGDATSALLEVLDPEQNKHFHDNYLDVDFDLSKVLFIATANSLATVPKPLIDRMEVIEVSGYVAEEKLEIARRHLQPRILKQLNVPKNLYKIVPEAIASIIENYTNESGVRQLEKQLTTIARKAILADLSGAKFPKTIKAKNLQGILGTPPYLRDKYEGNEIAGVVTGLAWTETGGVTLLAETSILPGKGKMTATGSLGDVMKESASIAYQWVKANSDKLGLDFATFEQHDLHVHFPEGAIPKDGPSAGITIATAIVSAFTGRKVRERLAMTGEITLRGKVLPVGGIKEKILAAKRAGITDVILSAANKKDVDDIPPLYTGGLAFHYVDTAAEVIEKALL